MSPKYGFLRSLQGLLPTCLFEIVFFSLLINEIVNVFFWCTSNFQLQNSVFSGFPNSSKNCKKWTWVYSPDENSSCLIFQLKTYQTKINNILYKLHRKIYKCRSDIFIIWLQLVDVHHFHFCSICCDSRRASSLAAIKFGRSLKSASVLFLRGTSTKGSRRRQKTSAKSPTKTKRKRSGKLSRRRERKRTGKQSLRRERKQRAKEVKEKTSEEARRE